MDGKPKSPFEIAVERFRDARNEDFGSDAFDGAAMGVWALLKAAHRDVLRQVLKGPVYDGDICSKAHRDDLIKVGLATRCSKYFEDGYTIGTYLGASLWRAIHAEA